MLPALLAGPLDEEAAKVRAEAGMVGRVVGGGDVCRLSEASNRRRLKALVGSQKITYIQIKTYRNILKHILNWERDRRA